MHNELVEERIYVIEHIIQALSESGSIEARIEKYKSEKRTLLEIQEGKYESDA